MIEVLISFGAIELALDFVPGEFPTLLERVPAPLRNRLRFVGNPSLRNNVETMLSPVYEEFGIESLHGGFGLKFKSVGQPPGLGDLVGIVWSSLYDFLVGAKNCLQIDIDLAAFVPLFVNFGVVPVTRVPEPISPYLRASYAPIRDGRWSALAYGHRRRARR